MADDFSNEGLYRLIEGMRDQHGEDLREIRRQTTETNGRVRVLEARTTRNDQELKRINAAIFPRTAQVSTSTPVASQGPDINLKLSPRMWAALIGLASAFSVFIPPLVSAVKKWWGLE